MALRVLNSVWVGESLGALERLCVMSGLAAGHEFHVYSYEPEKLRGVPEGAEIRDAAEVMPRERMIAYADSGSLALGSNFWRYEMLAQGRGYWVDLDVLLLKPLDFDEEFVFGREPQGTVNNAVLLAPATSALVRDLVTFPKSMRKPPWFGPRRTLRYYLTRLRAGALRLQDLPWGTYGPQMLEHFVTKHKLQSHVANPEIFYPVSWENAGMLYGPSEKVEALLSDQTRAIHLYKSQLRGLAKTAPPAGSFMAKQFKKFGVDMGAADRQPPGRRRPSAGVSAPTRKTRTRQPSGSQEASSTQLAIG